MKDRTKIQVQAVLFQNDTEQLLRAVRTIDAAAAYAKGQGISVSLHWGDASNEPIYSQGSWKAVQQQCAHLEKAEYRFFHQNTGYGAGNNLLAENSDADYLLIMNPEILLSPHTISELMSPFQDERIGLVEARQIPVEHPKAFDPETGETSWSSGACFLIPTALFHQLHGFDTQTFFMYCEDVDFSWQVRKAGFRLYYQTLAGVYHSRHLSSKGRNLPSLTEQKYTILSEALLAYKWNYPEYARERIRLAVQRCDPGAMEAMQEFGRLEKRGALPDFQDPDHEVAKIIQFPDNGGMLFCPHRFSL